MHRCCLTIFLLSFIPMLGMGQVLPPSFWEDPYEESVEFDTVCATQYVWHNKTYIASGFYTDTILQGGLKTVVHLALTLSPPDTVRYYIYVPQDELPYAWNGQNYQTEGTYEVHLINSLGCDSVEELYLHILQGCTPQPTVLPIHRP